MHRLAFGDPSATIVGVMSSNDGVQVWGREAQASRGGGVWGPGRL